MRSMWSVILLTAASLVFAGETCFCRDRVCIDPGHGGSDPGCVGRVYGVQENGVNLGMGLWGCGWGCLGADGECLQLLIFKMLIPLDKHAART